MDIEFSAEDLEFQKEVQEFINDNLPTGMDIWTKRGEWFEALKSKGGWDAILPANFDTETNWMPLTKGTVRFCGPRLDWEMESINARHQSQG